MNSLRGKPTLRIDGPADLLQAVPYLLGFHPRDSLVLVGLNDSALVVTARLDLADLAAEDLLPRVVVAIDRGGATKLVAAVYDSQPLPRSAFGLPWAGVARELRAACAQVGCEVGDVLRVADGRWWSYGCTDAACCPPEGTPLPDAPSPFVAEAAFAGLVALPDRAALAATLDPLPEADRARLQPLLADARRVGSRAADRAGRDVRRALFAAARAADRQRPGPELDDAAVARFGVALALVPTRDALWSAVDGQRLDGRELWRELARRLPGPYDVPPLFLYGWASWRAGNGALAQIAAERAAVSDPHYSAMDLLRSVLGHGLDPRRVPRLGEREPAGSCGRRRSLVRSPARGGSERDGVRGHRAG